MPAKKAVLFDLDGTLVDSLADLANAMNHTLEQMGFPAHPTAAYRYFVGDGMETLVRRVLPSDRRDRETEEQCLAGMLAEYGSRWAETTRPYPGIPELLDGLTTRAVPTVILSNKPDDFTRQVVARLLPRWHFVVIAGARAGIPKKPDPAAALEIAAEIGYQPSDFLYVGDTNTDMRTATAAGMTALGAAWGFRTEEELLDWGAVAILNRPEELLPWLDGNGVANHRGELARI